MKIFISYKFNGKSIEDVESLITPVTSCLKEIGHDVYCNYFDPTLQKGTEKRRTYSNGDYIRDAVAHIDDRDCLIALLDSEDKSEGMLLEVGCALGKGVRIIVARHTGVKSTYLHEIGESFEWDTMGDLLQKIQPELLNGSPR